MEIYLKHLKDKYFKQKGIYNNAIYKNKDISDKSLQQDKQFYEDAEKYVYSSNDPTGGVMKITINKPVYKDIDKDLENLNIQQKNLLEILNTHFLSPDEYEKYMNQYLQNKTEIDKLLSLIKKTDDTPKKEIIISSINNIQTQILNIYKQLKQIDKNEQPTDWKNMTEKYFSLKNQKHELVSRLNADYGIEEKPETPNVLYTAGKDHPYFYFKKYTDNSTFNMILEKDYSIKLENNSENVLEESISDSDVVTKKKSKKKNDCNDDYKCPEDKICNKDTGNCVSKKGTIGKKILLGVQNESTNEKIPKVGNKNKNCNEGYECPQDKICNPPTGKCVTKKGAIGKKILESSKPKNDTSLKEANEVDKKKPVEKINSSKNCNDDFICPEDKICNPKTGKCVKKDGKIGKELVNQQKGGKKVILKM